MVQGELFQSENSVSSLSGFDRKKSFLSRYQVTLTLDKTLLILIANVIIFALTYSFGVEHGKRSVEKSIETLIPAHSDTVSLKTTGEEALPRAQGETVLMVNQGVPAPQDPGLKTELQPTSLDYTIDTTTAPTTIQTEVPTAPVEKPKPTVPVVDLSKKGSYTIQLVTYADQEQALKEINRLKTNGHEGFVIMSGKFYQVCANYFDNKTSARSFLKKFNDLSRYPDAYIRPVVR